VLPVAKVARDLLQKARTQKIAKFLISKGPDTAAEYLEGLRKIMAAKDAAKAKALAKVVEAPIKKPKKPTAKQMRARAYYAMRRMVGRDTGDG
jgi:16S rRNA C1402 N4-methylase RsmH